VARVNDRFRRQREKPVADVVQKLLVIASGQAARLEKLDSIPAGVEPLRKAESKPWRPIKPLRKLNGTHILPEATE